MKHVRWIIPITIIGIICLFLIGCSKVGTPVDAANTAPADAHTTEPEMAVTVPPTEKPMPEPTPTPTSEPTQESTPTPEPTPTPTPEPTPLPPLELTFETAQKYRHKIMVKDHLLFVVDETGNVSVKGLRSEFYDATQWTNVRSIAAVSGALFGFFEDGSVDCLNTSEEIHAYVHTLKNVADIKTLCRDIFQVTHSDGSAEPIILITDGILDYAYLNGRPDQSDMLGISGWTDVIDYAATEEWIAGLMRDGTVYYQAMKKSYDRSGTQYFPVDSNEALIAGEWTGIVEIGSVRGALIGVKEDGTFVSTSKSVQNMFQDVKRIVLYGRDDVSYYLLIELTNGGYTLIGNSGRSIDEKQYAGIDLQSVSDICAGKHISNNGHVYQWGAVLYQDGTVVPFGGENAFGETDTGLMHDIVALSYDEDGDYLDDIACLRADGTVTVLGDNTYGQIETSNWTDIMQVKVIGRTVFGLRRDGTVVCTGRNAEMPSEFETISGWNGMKAVFFENWQVHGITEDGKWKSVSDTPLNVFATQENKKLIDTAVLLWNVFALWDDGTLTQDNVGSWPTLQIPETASDLTAIEAGSDHIAALKRDGTVICFGIKNMSLLGLPSLNLDYGQFNTGRWTDIVQIAVGNRHTVGLKQDGTVVAVGENDKWYGAGRCEVSGWTDIVAVAAGFSHTVGLKKDGTVVATGENSTGCCSVDGWTDIVAIAAGDYYTVGIRRDGSILIAGFTNTDALDALPSLTPFDRIP